MLSLGMSIPSCSNPAVMSGAAAGDKPDQVYAIVVVEGGPGQEEEEKSEQKE